MTGVEDEKGCEGGDNKDLNATIDKQQNGTLEKAPVVSGTNMETLSRPGKQSDPNTAFLRAARAGQLEKVLEFLESGVDINASNANGLNALHLAAKDGHLEIVQELLTRGATVDAATKKGNTALHIASLAGQEEVVQLLVQRGASVNAQSQNGFTPLYMAAQENHDSVVKFLLSKGANQTLATEDGFTPLAVAMQQGHDKVVAVLLENDTRGKVRLPALHIAAKKDDCKAAALLLQNDHNPDVTSKSGFTPLHIAAHYGNDRIASLLYEKGANVNFAAKHNITPMHVAAKWGKIKMVNLLMSKGANIAAKTRDGLTPLHCAARAGHHEVVDILIEKGAPIGSKTKNGLAPLHMASQGDHVDAARILLYHRAPVDEVTVDYLTALHVAAHCGHVRVAKLLLDRNADPNSRALNGFTPLHIACKKNRIKVVELLLKHKASIEATTESGLTPLHVASFMGCMNIVIYLLQNEASPDIPTVRGETPLHLAARANQTDIIRILLRNGAQVDARAREEQTPLHVASRLGNVDIVMLLLQHGANVDATTKDLYTPLHIASKEGQEEVASVLLENGASLTATTKKGFTPLHLAAKYGNMNVARLLLQKNAPVDMQGKNGVTPLHVASHYDHQNVALLLLDKGASPHAMAKNGHTPLHIAARKNQMDIATTLLEYGAKANAESKAGFTPLHLSSQEGHTDMSTLLIEHKADTNHKAKNGLTPLHLCAQEDKTNVATILVKNNAHIDAKTKAGYTPLHVAAHFGQAAMVRFLLRSGATVDSSTGAGYTPLHQAAQQGHTLVINLLLENKAKPNAVTNNEQTALAIAQKLGYISVIETLKVVTETTITTTHTINIEEKYKVQAPESMQETFMSDSEDEGGEDPMLSDQQQYRYMTVDDMKSMGDDSMRVNVTDDERDNRHSGGVVNDVMTKENYQRYNIQNVKPDNIDIHRNPVHVGFLVSFLVDARGGAMRGCRHSGVRVIVPPRKAAMPMRITCRYLKRDKLTNPPPLMEGEALASRILELGPVGAKFLGPVIIEVPHFASLRGKEREIVILRSDNGETWREHTLEASEEAVQDVLNESFEGEELSQLEDLQTSRIVRILTVDFPHYFAVVSRIRQEVHAVGPEGGTVSSSAVPQVQAVFPPAALTKKIRVGLQAHPIPAELVAKLLGNRVAVSPIVTVEPRRRKFHKPITLTIPVPQAANKGMINQYSGDAPTLRLLCSITGGQSRAVWEDVTGSTPLTFVKDCVSFTTTVSARFWLMDCRNITEATRMATELYTHATHVPFMAKFVVFAKRMDSLEARLRVFCMTDDKEDKTLEHQEHFTEVAKSRDVEVLEGKTQYMEFAGNLVPVLKSGEQLQLPFRAFKENRVPFTARIKDPDAADMVGRIMFMSEPKVAKGEPPQSPICTLNILLPEKISPETGRSQLDLLELSKNYSFLRDGGLSRPDAIHRATIRLTDIANLLDSDWEKLAEELNITPTDVNMIKNEHPGKSALQAASMFKLWQNNGNKSTGNALEQALNKIGREDIVKKCIFNVELVTDDVEKAVARVRLDQPGFDSLKEELGPSRDSSLRRDGKLANEKLYDSYEEPNKTQDSESVENVSHLDDMQHKSPKQQHITITNGTMFNGTSTPIKDKYANDEKMLTDDISEFLENKYNTMEQHNVSKKIQDEIDGDNNKDRDREKVIEDANKLVLGVIQVAEKEKKKLGTEGLSGVNLYHDQIMLDKNSKTDKADKGLKKMTDKKDVKEIFDKSKTDIKYDPALNDSNKKTITKTIVIKKEIITPKENIQTIAFDTNVPIDLIDDVTAEDIIRVEDNSDKMLAEDDKAKNSPKKTEILVSDPIEKVQKQESNIEKKKKREKPGFFSNIFTGSQAKKENEEKSKNLNKPTMDENNSEMIKITEDFLDDTKLITNQSNIVIPTYPDVEIKTTITSPSLPDSKPNPNMVYATVDFLYDARRSAEAFIPQPHEESYYPVKKVDNVAPEVKESDKSAVLTTDLDKNIKLPDTKHDSREKSVPKGDEKKDDHGDEVLNKTESKTEGFLGIFKSPKLKKDKRNRLKNKSGSKDVSFDSGEEDSKTENLDDTKKDIKKVSETVSKDISSSANAPVKDKSLEDSDATKIAENTTPITQDAADESDVKHKGIFGLFKNKRRSQSKERSSSKERSFDSGDEDIKQITNQFLEDTKKISSIDRNIVEEQRPNVETTISEIKGKSDDKNSRKTPDITDESDQDNDSADQKAKKNKEKGKGFFSNIFKGTKSTANDLKEDIKEITDDIKKEGKQVEDSSKKEIESKKSQIAEEMDSINDNLEKMNQNISKIIDDVNKETDSIKESSKQISDDVKSNVDNKVNDIITNIEKDKSIIENTVVSKKEQLQKDVDQTYDKSKKLVQDTADDVQHSMDKAAATVVEFADKSKQAIRDEKAEAKKAIKGITDDIPTIIIESDEEVNAKISSNLKIKDESETSHKTEKKNKEPKKGFISGILKSIKHTTDEVADNVKEFVDDTKKEALEEEQKAEEAAKDAASQIKSKTSQVVGEIEDKKDATVKQGKQIVSDGVTSAEKKVSDITKSVNEAAQNIKADMIKKEEEISKETKHIVDESKRVTSDKIEDASDYTKELEKKVDHDVKKVKEKSKGFFSNLFKGTKHATEELKDDIKDVADDLNKKLDKEKQFEESIKNDLQQKKEELKSEIKKGESNIKDGVEKIKNNIDMKIESVEESLKSNQDQLKSTINGNLENISSSIKEKESNLADSVTQLEKQSKKNLQHTQDMTDNLLQATAEKIDQSKKKIADTASKLSDESKKAVEAEKEKVEGAFEDMKNRITDIVDNQSKPETKIDKTHDSKHKMEIKDSNVSPKASEKNKDSKDGFFLGILKSSKRTTDEVVDDIGKVVDDTKKDAKDTAKQVQSKSSQIVADVEDKSQSVIKQGKESISSAVHTVEKKASDMHQSIGETAQDIKEGIKKTEDDVSKEIKSIVDESKRITSDKRKDISDFSEALEKKVDHDTKKAKEKGKGFFSTLFKGTKNVSDEVNDNVKDVVDNLDSELDKVKELEKSIDKSIIDEKQELLNFLDKEKSIADDNINKTKETVEDLKTKISEKEKKIKDTSKDIKENVDKFIDSKKEDLSNAVKQQVDNLQDLAEDTEKQISKTKKDKETLFFGLLKHSEKEVDKTLESSEVALDDVKKTASDNVKNVEQKLEKFEESSTEKIQGIKDELEKDVGEMKEKSGFFGILKGPNHHKSSKTTKKLKKNVGEDEKDEKAVEESLNDKENKEISKGAVKKVTTSPKSSDKKIIVTDLDNEKKDKDENKILNIVSNAKNATIKFWEETKHEGQHFSASYDVSSPQSRDSKTKSENLESKLESFKVIDDKINESIKEIKKEKLTDKDKKVTSTTPQPSPNNFEDNSLKDITEEAAKRAQMIAEQETLKSEISDLSKISEHRSLDSIKSHESQNGVETSCTLKPKGKKPVDIWNSNKRRTNCIYWILMTCALLIGLFAIYLALEPQIFQHSILNHDPRKTGI